MKAFNSTVMQAIREQSGQSQQHQMQEVMAHFLSFIQRS